MTPIRLAILGSGIFARDTHLPQLIQLHDLFEIVAIYSRNAETAAALAAKLPGNVSTYTELEPLLAREDIDAVDIVLPIAIQHEAVEASLRAGKHVISEKPVAPDVATGRQLLQTASELTSQFGTTWMVAENYRYETAYQMAGEIIRRGDIGAPIQLNWITTSVMDQQNKYYYTQWRRDNSFPGGMIMDSGVHTIAALRSILGEVESVSAYTRQIRADLPPADTLSATLRFTRGALGTWNMTFAAKSPWEDGAIRIVGERGAMRVTHQRIEVVVAGETTVHEFQANAIQAEFKDFAQVIQGGTSISTPEDALQDVAIIQALLESARTGRSIEPERIV